MKNNKTLAIVLSHADTIFRKELLKKCVESIDYDVLISSNYPIDSDIQLMCKYSLYDSNNPLLYKEDYGKYNITYYYWCLDDNGERIYKLFDYEHGFAAYTLINNGMRFAKDRGYENVHIINYDYQISNEELIDNENILDSELHTDAIFYEYYDRGFDTPAYCTGFFSGRVNVLKYFFCKYNSQDEYYTSCKDKYMLEDITYNYFNNSIYVDHIKCKSFDDLSNTEKTNQEGVLEFSKS